MERLTDTQKALMVDGFMEALTIESNIKKKAEIFDYLIAQENSADIINSMATRGDIDVNACDINPDVFESLSYYLNCFVRLVEESLNDRLVSVPDSKVCTFELLDKKHHNVNRPFKLTIVGYLSLNGIIPDMDEYEYDDDDWDGIVDDDDWEDDDDDDDADDDADMNDISSAMYAKDYITTAYNNGNESAEDNAKEASESL